jgi:uncharacterized protein YqeY
MSLQQEIKEKMKEAMKAKEKATVLTLRGLMSAFTNELVAQGKVPTEALSDEDAIKVITKEAKKRKDAIQQYSDAGREELASDEKEELAILEAYLPELMSEDEIKTKVQEKKEELGISDPSEKGKLIGALMQDLQGKADGSLVQKVVQEELS